MLSATERRTGAFAEGAKLETKLVEQVLPIDSRRTAG
jgi:hypothetical protein